MKEQENQSMKKKIKVIFDTNIWISFLIGKKLYSLKKHIVNNDLEIIISPQIITELRIVTNREKLKKHFPKEKISEFILLLQTISKSFETTNKYTICRDAKDNFLLDLIEISKANYLITGDKDLLELNSFLTAKIVTPTQFEQILSIIK